MTSRYRFFAFLAVLLVASILAPIVAGKYGWDELVSNWFWGGIWIAASAIAFVVLFVCKLVSVPAQMYSELEARFEAQSAPLALRATERHREIISQLSTREAQLLVETVGGRRLMLRHVDHFVAKGSVVSIENGRAMGGLDVTLKMWGQENVEALYRLRDKGLLICTGSSGVCPLTQDGQIVAAVIVSGGLLSATSQSISRTPSGLPESAE